MKNDEEEKMQTGFRTWIKKPVGVLSVLLIAMIIVSYFCGSQKYTLDKHIIILTVILVVLVLSESFSEIAVGSLLSLKRRTGELKEDLTAAREETSELRNQLSTIVSSVSNKNINYISQSMKDTLLQKNFDEEITEESSGSAQPDEMGEFPADSACQVRSTTISRDTEQDQNRSYSTASGASIRNVRKLAEEYALQKFAEMLDLSPFSVIQGVKLSRDLDLDDPIMSAGISFDAYVKTDSIEYFIDVQQANSSFYRYKLYTMISQIKLYGEFNHKKTKLVLLAVELPEEYRNGRALSSIAEQINKDFFPAILSQILEVVEIRIDRDALDDFNKAQIDKSDSK